jgi:hypothetical protein
MEKNKLIVDDRIERLEINHDKLKANFKGIEDAVGQNDISSRKRSVQSNAPGIAGD